MPDDTPTPGDTPEDREQQTTPTPPDEETLIAETGLATEQEISQQW